MIPVCLTMQSMVLLCRGISTVQSWTVSPLGNTEYNSISLWRKQADNVAMNSPKSQSYKYLFNGIIILHGSMLSGQSVFRSIVNSGLVLKCAFSFLVLSFFLVTHIRKIFFAYSIIYSIWIQNFYVSGINFREKLNWIIVTYLESTSK